MRQNDGPARGRAKVSIESRRILHKIPRKSTRGVRANTLNRPDAPRARASRGSARFAPPIDANSRIAISGSLVRRRGRRRQVSWVPAFAGTTGCWSCTSVALDSGISPRMSAGFGASPGTRTAMAPTYGTRSTVPRRAAQCAAGTAERGGARPFHRASRALAPQIRGFVACVLSPSRHLPTIRSDSTDSRRCAERHDTESAWRPRASNRVRRAVAQGADR